MIVNICIAYFFHFYPKNATFCVRGPKFIKKVIYTSITMGSVQTISTKFLNLVMIRGGAQSAPRIFICENNRKSNKIMHCVEKK